MVSNKNLKLLSATILALLWVSGTLYAGTTADVKVIGISEYHSAIEANRGVGGVAKLATALNILSEPGVPTFKFSSGDNVVGTIFYTIFDGQAETMFLNLLGFDASSLGNHEFDKGPEFLAEILDLANFPYLAANVEVTEGHVLQGKFKPWTIVEKGPVRAGVIGLVIEETPVISNPGPGIRFTDSVVATRRAVEELTHLGIDFIVLVSHSGETVDQAVVEAVPGIDVVLSGHTGTVIREPIVVMHDGAPTLIFQAGSRLGYVGSLDVRLEDGVITSWSYMLLPLEENIQPDPAISSLITVLGGVISAQVDQPIGRSAVLLEGVRETRVSRERETNMGDLITDTMLWANPQAEIAIQNGGGIRADIPAGQVTSRQILEVLPFGNTMVILELTGMQILEALENGVSQYENNAGRFAQVAGLSYTFDPSQPVGSRIVDVKFAGAPLDLERVYAVVTNNFMADGGDGYTVFQEAQSRFDTQVGLAEAVIDFIQEHTPVNPGLEGRITRVGG